MANPWSYAELRLHRILREAGITELVANRVRAAGDRVATCLISPPLLPSRFRVPSMMSYDW
jgi:hypothetical protein